jgi:hypothetical protein
MCHLLARNQNKNMSGVAHVKQFLQNFVFPLLRLYTASSRKKMSPVLGTPPVRTGNTMNNLFVLAVLEVH